MVWMQCKSQIRHRCLVPTFMYLHSNSTQILALKKLFFSLFRTQKNFQNFFYKIIMQLFSADAIVFLKKLKKKFLTPKKWKNGPQKLLIIGPDPFISQSSQHQRPTAQNWFFILWNLGTRHLFSYLCYIIRQKNIYLCQQKNFYPSLFLKIAQLLQLQYLESVFHVGLKD